MGSLRHNKVVLGVIVIIILTSSLACHLTDAMKRWGWARTDLDSEAQLNPGEESPEALVDEGDPIPAADDPMPVPEDAEELAAPPESGLGMVITEGEALSPSHTVVVYKGNVLEFVNKPGMIAYANSAEYPSPEGVTLTTSSGSGVATYLQGVFLTEEGAWIQVSTSKAVTAMGAQIWGDVDDGWAEILVDGTMVWRGYTRGTDAYYPGGAYVNYVEVKGLALGPHTLEVRNGGGGVTTVLLIGIGGLYE